MVVGVEAAVFLVAGAFARGSLVAGVSVLVSFALSAFVMTFLAMVSLVAGALEDVPVMISF